MKISVHTDRLPAYRTYLTLLRETEDFFTKDGYLKIEAPVLSPHLIPESYLEVFATEFVYQGTKTPLYLTPSPELFLKRVLAYGLGNCFYLGKAFRNSEPDSDRHSFEFTMLELYKTQATYLDIANVVFKLLRHLAVAIYGKPEITFHGKKVVFDEWEKLSVAQAFREYASISPEDLFTKERFTKRAKEKGYRTEGFSYEDLFSQIYVQEVEPRLGMRGRPTLLFDYPKEFAALAKLNIDGTAQRFEFYIGGVELGDCYTELTDWKEQSERFAAEEKRRKELGLSAHSVDKGFIEALQYGLVPCSGIAIGFERLAMVFTDSPSIQEMKLITLK